MKKIKIIEVKSEIGAGTRGSSMGVEAIKVAGYDFGSDFFNKHDVVEIPAGNKSLFDLIHNEYAKHIPEIFEVVERLANEVKKAAIDPDVFPIILEGDHSNAIGTVAGI